MSSTSSGRRAPPAGAAASPGHKRARDDTSASPSDPDSASAKNTRSGFSSSPFADFGSYMAAKNSKLAAQFDADASTSGADSGGLFAGISIFVDGFTVPSSQVPASYNRLPPPELKEIMLNNGGRFVNYFSRHTVTHIVCSHLPDSKMKNLRAFSKGLPVVKPAWVVDSLAENRLLNYIKAGMFVRDAKARCAHLVIVPYNFSAYEEVADQFYGTLHKYCNKVQALSCDEAFLDMTECLHDNPEEVTWRIRSEIFDATKCTASAGIGHTVSAKLSSKEIEYCSQLRNISKDVLHKDFGKKTGDLLWNYCRGVDHSTVGAVQETKSVGAEINWGVRFNVKKDAEHFVTNLCKEVSLRLQGCGVQGRTITLKIAGATDSFVTLQRIAKQLFASFHADVKEVRGVGLTVTKLEHADLIKKQGREKICFCENVDVAGVSERHESRRSGPSSIGVASHSSEVNPRSDRSTGVNNVGLPPLSHLDPEVLKNLPPEIISEIDDMYKGELHGFLDMLNSNKGKASSSKSLALPAVTQSSVPVDDAKFEGYAGHRDSKYLEDDKGKSVNLSEVKAANDASCSRSSGLVLKTAKSVTQLDLMPDSLSQADLTVLQELPEDVQADLFNMLPLHRPGDPTSSASNVCEKKVCNDNEADDPKEQHTDSSSSQPLSSILEPLASFVQLCPSSGTEEWNEALSCLSELLTQYIQLKVETDIEELYKCFCLLKRFGSVSEFFLELNNSVIPFLQDSVSQHYGGTLHF
ncbi:hypothetical protein PR202_ga14551 [Eleusine coracana subsp. coracana]|uniref:DNA repair protein REV1 n=1 Tax=Eleusine coracana subsp. coracana TaxID=191504 RepID=A0AAV5CHU7_ELECO|nr:hypothetical protein PR202_ga14551 [Eleusine coracana subsp. coracana]